MKVARVRVGDVLRLERNPIDPAPLQEYTSIGVRSFGKGIFHYEPKLGDHLGRLRFFDVAPGRLVISNIKAWEGAVAISGADDGGCIASNRFLQYVAIDQHQLDVNWAAWYFLSEAGNEMLQRASPGSADRNRTLAIGRFEDLHIPLPPIAEQHRAARSLRTIRTSTASLSRLLRRRSDLAGALPASLAVRDDLRAEAKESRNWRQVPLSDLLEPSTAAVQVEPTETYRLAGIYSFGRGFIDRGTILGSETSYKKLTRLRSGDIVVSKLNGWEGAVAVVDDAFAGAHVSSEYPTFAADRGQLHPGFFRGIARSPSFWRALDENTRGSMVRRRRINPTHFLATKIWLPSLDEQARIAGELDGLVGVDALASRIRPRLDVLLAAALNKEFAGLR